MASRINPVPLMTLIVCVIMTLIFTILVITKSSDIRRLREGDPDKPAFRSIEKLRGEVKDKETAISQLQKTIEADRAELYRLDLQGNVRRLYYSEGELLGPVSMPNSEEGMIRNVQVKYKDSSWKLLSELLAYDVKYMDALKAEYAGPERQTYPSLDDAIHRRQDQLKVVLKTIQEQDAAFAADRDRLVAQNDSLIAKRDLIDRTRRSDEGIRKTRINQLEDKIRMLLELDLHWVVDRDPTTNKVLSLAGLEPLGKVLQIDAQGGKVVIDKGNKDRIFPGLLFEVFNYDRGAYVNKGKVEVIEVQEEIAVCRILAQSDFKHDPISRQDFIGNPVFNSHKPKVFVVAGDFKHYNREDLESFIRHTGGVVWPHLAPGVDFLVAGDRSDKARAAARQYQILGMHEEDLLQYVQTTFQPKGDHPADSVK